MRLKHIFARGSLRASVSSSSFSRTRRISAVTGGGQPHSGSSATTCVPRRTRCICLCSQAQGLFRPIACQSRQARSMPREASAANEKILASGTAAKRRRGLTDRRIYSEIYSAIINHQLRPATALQEDGLAKAFGVSRTVIRKVLHRLAHERLVELYPNRAPSSQSPRSRRRGRFSRPDGPPSASSSKSLFSQSATRTLRNWRRS